MRTLQGRAFGVASPQLWATAIAVAATLLGDQMLYVVMPSRPSAWGLSIAAVGVLLSANRFVRLLSNPAAALVFRRFGPRLPFAAAIVGAVVITASYGWVSAFWALLLARIGWGICWSMLRMGGQWTVLEEATDANRGLLIGSYSAIARSGALAGALLGGLLTDAWGHRPTLTLFAVATALGGLVWYRSIRGRQRSAPYAPHAGSGAGLLLAVVRDRGLMAVSACGLLVGLVAAGLIAASLGFYLREQYGEEIAVGLAVVGVTSLTGIVIGAWNFLGLAAAPLAGHLSDRVGRGRGTSVALLLAALGVATLGLATSIWLVFGGLALALLGATAATVQLTTAAGDMAPLARRPAVLSTFATSQDLGAALGPVLALSFASLTALRGLFLAAAVLLVIASLVIRSALRDERRAGA